jgi:NAD-dependent SIR2 family protein deacetylase
MICASCGGEVTQRGAVSNLTHTQCAGCGAINNQQVEFNEEERDGDLTEIGSNAQ